VNFAAWLTGSSMTFASHKKRMKPHFASRLVLTAVVIGFFALALAARAAVQLASPFTSHMVLQCDMKVPVWGTAAPGETVTVAFAGQEKTATADADGHWSVKLDAMAPSADSRTLTVTGSNAAHTVRLEDVLVGEVWLCSGQSNMDFTVAKTKKYYYCGVTNEAAEVAAANHPNVRMFTGEWTLRYTPQTRVAGEWKICNPENVREFSAIGYFFARDLQQELKVPVGIVTLTYGASTAQAWIPRAAIAANPELKPVLDQFDAAVKAYVPLSAEASNQWQSAVAAAKAAGKRAPRNPHPSPVQNQHNPTVLFNGMVAPVIPFAVRGVLWYQGESITPPQDLFPLWNKTLIQTWRQLWGRELPFYFCQIAAYAKASPQTREWQADALRLPATAMAVTIDIGDKHSVHPKDKQDVGYRLMRIALARSYGRHIEYSGPQYESMQVDGRSLALTFTHADDGLVARGGPLRTFEIAGADGKFVPADAHIDGDKVVVSSPEISAPQAARYAWAPYPDGCNLYNAAELPAAPFRTEAPARH
jgi:sialate O-acetylesterase